MENLHLIGVYEDGEFLLLGGPDGKSRYRLRLDDSLRAAVRWERGASRIRPVHAEPLRPRDVQTMIRAGATAEEAAERAGWTVEKVRRYEGPILAEREHMAWLAGLAVLRSRNAVSFAAPTLGERVGDRLSARGVEVESARWDSWRSEDGQWTVELHFTAGGRARTASWHFNRSTMTVVAVDDEARWLSEEEHAGQTPTARHVVTSGQAHVYDIEAEGGLEAPATRRPESEPASRPEPGAPARAGESDLLTSMRERSAARTRRRPPRRGASSPTDLPTDDLADIEMPPLEHLDYDPDTMPEPPAAHADPQPDGLDGRPEPAALADAELPGLAEEPQLSFDNDDDLTDDEPDDLVAHGEDRPVDDEREQVAPAAHEATGGPSARSASDPATPEAEPAAVPPPAAPPTQPAAATPADQSRDAQTESNDDGAAPAAAAKDQTADEPAAADSAPKDEADEPANAPKPPATQPAAAKPAAPARRGGTPRAQPRQRGARAGKPRPSVPAWDDIVFGGGKPSGE